MVPAAILLLFRAERAPTIIADAVRRQHRVLGALSQHEFVTIAAVVIFVAGLILKPVLHVDAGWIATVTLVVVVAGGVVDRTVFRSGIDWGFLVLFGLLISTGSVFHSAGIDSWIAREFTPLARLAGRPVVVVALLGIVVAACRVVLARVPTNFLLSLALIPVAPRFKLSPWLVGFIVLTVGNAWLVPGLSDFYVLMREGTRGEMFTEREALRMGIVVTVVVLAAITAAVPYWRAIGLISR